MAIKVTPRHPALGAEIRGVDMTKPVDPETVKQVHDAWMKHLVVVFPDQKITDAQHVAFTRNFGEPEIFGNGLEQPPIGMASSVVLQNVEDETFFNGLAHGIEAEGRVGTIRLWHAEELQGLVLGCGGECQRTDVR